MQFKVPQFLEIEDKIIGPFTFREFAYLTGGGGACFVLYKSLGLYLGALPILIVGGLAAALTFYHPNGKPFIFMLEAGIKYIFQDKLYIWKKEQNKVKYNQEIPKLENREVLNNNTQRLTTSKLRDLAWSLDVMDLKK